MAKEVIDEQLRLRMRWPWMAIAIPFKPIITDNVIPHLGAWKSTMSCTSFFSHIFKYFKWGSCFLFGIPSAIRRAPSPPRPSSFTLNSSTHLFHTQSCHLRLALVACFVAGAPRRFVWQASHLVTLMCLLCGKRGT